MSTETKQQPREGTYPEKRQERRAIAPPVDIYENADEVLVMADLPGIGKDSLRIHLDKGQLTIEGRRNESGEGNELAAEFGATDYRRSFVLPPGIQADGITAELNYGVLRVHLPKSAAQKPRQIQVRAG
jgi:HSP20 family molecular chaperone IbpA